MAQERAFDSGFLRIKRFLIKHYKAYLAGFVVLAVISVLQLLSPRVAGQLIDYLNHPDRVYSGAVRYMYILLMISVLLLLLNYLSRLLLIQTANTFAHDERTNMFNKIIELSMNFFSQRSTGGIMALTTNDVEAIRHMLGRGVMLFFNMIFIMITSIIMISATVSFSMAMLLLIPMPLIFFVMIRFGIAINKRFRNVQQTFQEMTEKAQENVTGIRVIKSFVQEDHESEAFAKLNKRNYKANISLVKIQGVFSPLISLIMDIGQFFVLLVGGGLALKGSISLGDFIALNSYIAIIMSPIRMIGNLINQLQRGRASMQRISDVLVLAPEIYDGKFDHKTQGLVNTNNILEFRNLSFDYNGNGNNVLNDISFAIKKGHTLGIIGRVGSGKSTIANLILRLYETKNRGEILIKGKDISEYTLYELREMISYVPQENILFSDTFQNNIDFMPSKHEISDIEDAAKKAFIYDRIMETEKKFNTRIGERGVNISGGEKQRLSIARALLKQTQILILDDCLSAVDTNTESSIIDSLKKERGNKATIIISHRISTVRDADEIIVLDNGYIAERGNHASLIATDGTYRKIHDKQTLEEEILSKQVVD